MNTSMNIQLSKKAIDCLETMVLPGDVHTLSEKIEYLAVHYSHWQDTIAFLESSLLCYQSALENEVLLAD